MPAKQVKSRAQRSRTVSRSRSTSRVRNASKKRSMSRSPSRKSVSKNKSPASESKLPRRRSPSLSSESHDETINKSITRKRTTIAPSASKPGVRASLRIIEKLESSQLETKSSSSPNCNHEKKIPIGFVNKLKSAMCSVYCAMNHFLCSQGLACFNTIFVVPAFVFWAVFLIISPTSEKSFETVPTQWGRGLAFGGVAWPTDVLSYFQLYVLIGVILFYNLVVLTSLIIPFGRRLTVVAGGRRSEIKANGLLVMLLFIVCVGALQYKGADYVVGFTVSQLCNYWPSIITGAWISAIYTAFVAFWHSRNIRRSSVNSNKLSGNIFIDFCNGREIRPLIIGLDLKMLLFYPSVIGLGILEFAVVVRQYEEHGKISLALATVLFLHGITLLDFFIFEPTVIGSFGMTHDGFGLERIQRLFLVVPFIRILTVLYLGYNFDVGYQYESFSYNGLLLVVSVVISCAGYIIRRCSTNQLYLFQRDPQHPSFDGLEKIPTSSGRRILAGGWWGRLRHPNYLGDILMTTACSVPAGFASPLAWITPVVALLVLLVHINRVERNFAEKYGPGWERYTARVPYRLVPRVY